jgi:hypothetical protein
MALNVKVFEPQVGDAALLAGTILRTVRLFVITAGDAHDANGWAIGTYRTEQGDAILVRRVPQA